MSRKEMSEMSPSTSSEDAVDLIERLESMESIALSTSPLRSRPNLRESILRSASPGDHLAGYRDRVATFFDIDLPTTERLLYETRDIWSDRWERNTVEGVRTRSIAGGPRVAGAECALIHLQPGTDFPEHRHLGDEWCFFLGGNGLEAGQEWNPGDMILNPAGSDHAVLSAVSEEPFILAVIVYEGIRFHGP